MKDHFLLEDSPPPYTGAQIVICAVIFAVVFSAAVYSPIAFLRADIDHEHVEMKGLACETPLTRAIVDALQFKLNPASKEAWTRLNGEMETLGATCTSFGPELSVAQKTWKDFSGLVKQTGHDDARRKSLDAFIDAVQRAAENVPKVSGLVLDTEKRAYYLIAPSGIQIWYAAERLQKLLDGISSGSKEVSVISKNIREKDIEVFQTDVDLALRGENADAEEFVERTKNALADYRAKTLAMIDPLAQSSWKKSNELNLYGQALSAIGKFWTASDENISRFFELRLSKIRFQEEMAFLRGALVALLAAFCAWMALRSWQITRLLKEHREFLEIIVSTTGCGFWVRNIETEEFWMSPRLKGIFGYKDHEIINARSSLRGIIHNEDLATMQKTADQFAAGTIDDANTLARFHHKQGHTGHLMARAILRRDASGRPVRVIGTALDVTDLESARKEAQEANIAKRDFLANMSHEIRTPMNGIIGMANLLLRTNLDKRQRNYAGIVARSAESLTGIINDILDISKVEAGKLTLDNAPFSLRYLSGEVANLVKTQAQNKNVEFLLNIAADVHDGLAGDQLRLRQVLLNLCGNAVKFTSRGSVSLDVSLKETDGKYASVRFAVRDTGIGISEEDIKKLFMKFQQADTSTARKFGGTGLGLFISQQIVSLMGGSIEVKSVPGVGSTFFFTLRLPLASVNALSQSENCSEKECVPDFQDKAVLLAEDNPINQEVISAMLEKFRIVPVIASNGREALSMVQSRKFDLILMDCQMPEMDGLEATRQIRAGKSNPDVKIVAVTASAMTEYRDLCFAAGMDDYISKPIREQAFNDVIIKYLSEENANPSVGLSINREVLDEFRSATGKKYNDLLSKLLMNTRELLDEIGRNLEQKNGSSIAAVAHRLKSGSGQIGATRLYHLAIEIEKLAVNGDCAGIAPVLMEAQNEFAKVKGEIS